MDKDLENIILETAMERYLLLRLRTEMDINEDLKKLLVKPETKVSPSDLRRLKEIERVVTILVKEAMDTTARHTIIYNLGQLIRK